MTFLLLSQSTLGPNGAVPVPSRLAPSRPPRAMWGECVIARHARAAR